MSKGKDWRGCGCPEGSRKVTTNGRGRGWACQGKRVGKTWRPYVAAVCSVPRPKK